MNKKMLLKLFFHVRLVDKLEKYLQTKQLFMLKQPIQLIQVNQNFIHKKNIFFYFSEARAILDEWLNDKLRIEAGLDDSDDEQIIQSNVRSVKQACNLSFDEDDQFEFLREPKDLFTYQDPSVYYETHDETDLVKDILHGLYLI